MSQNIKKPSSSQDNKQDTKKETAHAQTTHAKPVTEHHNAPHAAQAAPVSQTAAKAIEKTVDNARSTLETAHHSTKAVVALGTDKIKEMFANTTHEAQKSHAKAFDMTREKTQKVSRAMDAFERTVNDFISLSRQNVDVMVEISNIVSDIARNSNAEMIKNANHHFASSLDIYNEVLSCRNISDAAEIRNKWHNANRDAFFTHCANASETFFQIINEAFEPVSDHMLESAERFGKTFAA